MKAADLLDRAKSEFKGWGVSLPLVSLLILPFYSLPGANNWLAQIQMFQLLAILSTAIVVGRSIIPFYHPYRWLVVLALSQLIWASPTARCIFIIQMISISFIYFLSFTYAKMQLSKIAVVFCILAVISFLYSFVQLLEGAFAWAEGVPVPRYLMTDKVGLAHGIWGVQAYCGAFSAMAVPIVLSMRHKAKYVLVGLLILQLFWANSTFAKLALVSSLIWIYFARVRKYTHVVLGIVGVLFIAYYFTFDIGDASSEFNRFQVWEMTIAEGSARPFLGHGLGTFSTFGYANTLFQVEPQGVFYGHPHNELLLLYFEAGAVGLLLGLLFIARVLYLGLRYWKCRDVVYVTASLIGFIVIAMGQPLVHVVIMSVIGIALFGYLESRCKQKEGVL